MASVSITGTGHSYNGGWGTFTIGSGSGYTCRQTTGQYRTIVPVTITPDTGYIVNNISITIGLVGTTSTLLAGYLYNSLDTAKSSRSPAPSGYLASGTEGGSASNPTSSGRNCTISFSGLSISSTTTLYLWLYTTATSGVYQVWTKASGNVKKPTGSVTKQTAKTYSVTYNANGGSGTTAAQTKTHGTALTLRSNGFTAPTGYKFVNWNTKANGTGTSYAAGASYTSNSALTLYAQWTVLTYSVTYNANGGSGTTSAQTKTYGVNLTLRNNGFTAPTGKNFKTWNTNSSGTGTSYAAGATYTSNAALSLYAIW
jgi:hypothetical protein